MAPAQQTTKLLTPAANLKRCTQTLKLVPHTQNLLLRLNQ